MDIYRQTWLLCPSSRDTGLPLGCHQQKYFDDSDEMPEDSSDFSQYQLNRLLGRSEVDEQWKSAKKEVIFDDHRLSQDVGEAPLLFGAKVKSVYSRDQHHHLLLEKVEHSDGTITEVTEKPRHAAVSGRSSVQSAVPSAAMLKADESDDRTTNSDGVPTVSAFAGTCEQTFSTSSLADIKHSSKCDDSDSPKPRTNPAESSTVATSVSRKTAADNSHVERPSFDMFSQIRDEADESTDQTIDNPYIKQAENNINASPFLPRVSSLTKQPHNSNRAIEQQHISTRKISESSIESDDCFVEVEDNPVPGIQWPRGLENRVSERPINHSVNADDIPKVKTKKLDGLLFESLKQLEQMKRREEAAEKGLSGQIMAECEELLELIGLPYVKAPAEAEAQCAAMNRLGIVHGIITDDSDIWPFGAERVYRHVFSRKKEVQRYDELDIARTLGLNREGFILLAMLLGCDYTNGVGNVGTVAAMEVLAEFVADFETRSFGGIGCLQRFRKWYETAADEHERVNVVRSRLRRVACQFPPSFPDLAVYNAFLKPQVCNVQGDSLIWRPANVERLRSFVTDRLGWNEQKIRNWLLPALKRFQTHCSGGQTDISSYFPTQQGVTDLVSMNLRQPKRIAMAAGKLIKAKEKISSEERPSVKTRRKMRTTATDH